MHPCPDISNNSISGMCEAYVPESGVFNWGKLTLLDVQASLPEIDGCWGLVMQWPAIFDRYVTDFDQTADRF